MLRAYDNDEVLYDLGLTEPTKADVDEFLKTHAEVKASGEKDEAKTENKQPKFEKPEGKRQNEGIKIGNYEFVIVRELLKKQKKNTKHASQRDAMPEQSKTAEPRIQKVEPKTKPMQSQPIDRRTD